MQTLPFFVTLVVRLLLAMIATLIVYTFVVLVIAWVAAHAFLVAKPIPRIPYNRLARYMPWGDLITLGIYNWKTGEVFSWFSLQCLKHKSPLIQLFVPSFSTTHPTLVLADLREIEDIVTKRMSEIDRADMMHTWFGLVSPKATIGLKSKDKTFKEQRRLWNVVLSPKFLEEVAAQRFWEVAVKLAELWARKAEVSRAETGEELAFKAQEDIKLATLDGIWKMNAGSELGLLDAGIARINQPAASWKSWNSTVTFASTEMPEFYAVLGSLLMCLDWVMQGVSPRMYTWFFQVSGILARADREKDVILDRTINASRQRIRQDLATDKFSDTCSLDQVFRKDILLEAGGREPNEATTNTTLRDELLELLITGHETTASSIAWALKYLTDNPKTQRKLRSSLHAVFPNLTSLCVPSAEDIYTASIPYLDAVISETLRFSNTGPVSFRQTLAQCDILGRAIPAGTPILLVTAGPSYSSPQMPWIPEYLRSKSSQAKFPRRWSTSHSQSTSRDLSSFDPARWLNHNGTFNPDALHMLPFSAGPRGCFGKRIALLEMKVVLALLITRFDFPQLSKSLSGYAAKDGLTRRPASCYVMPRNVKEAVKVNC